MKKITKHEASSVTRVRRQFLWFPKTIMKLKREKPYLTPALHKETRWLEYASWLETQYGDTKIALEWVDDVYVEDGKLVSDLQNEALLLETAKVLYKRAQLNERFPQYEGKENKWKVIGVPLWGEGASDARVVRVFDSKLEADKFAKEAEGYHGKGLRVESPALSTE